MTRLLVSVRDADEAALALAAGVDLIDVKEPRAGSLGAASPEVVRNVLDRVAGRVPVSAALGELRDWIERERAPDSSPGPAKASPPRAWTSCEPRLAFAKLGLAGAAADSRWPEDWARHLGPAPRNPAAVAVIYADFPRAAAPAPEAVLDLGAALGCRMLLVDTWQKSAGDLWTQVPGTELARWLARARDLGWGTVLAGSLTRETLPRALDLGPDYVAVRGAACAGKREGSLSAARLARLVELVAEWRVSDVAPRRGEQRWPAPEPAKFS